MYDVSDDWIPIYDKSSLPGYYMAIGTSGNQFKCTGPAGYLMASIIEYVCIALYDGFYGSRSQRKPVFFLCNLQIRGERWQPRHGATCSNATTDGS